MNTCDYVDCELFVTRRDHARLSVRGQDYGGRPALNATLERRLLEAELEPTQYGCLLFEALFPEGADLLTGYRDGLTIARYEGKRLRLRLHISAEAPPELHDLHWELLYDARQQIAPARSQEISFSRHMGVPFQPGRAVPGRPRLLIVLSCPRDLPDYGLPAIGPKALQRDLTRALSPLADSMDWEFLEGPATVEHIRDQLIAGKFHVLHLAGHGLLLPEQTTARLALETDDRCARFIDEELFAEIFAGQRHLRLVSLIACHGGAISNRDPFSGLGPALVRRGIPAVLAMRCQISLGGAARFAEHFYRNLARSGQVDAAANEARFQLYLAESHPSEWGTPALFMRLVDGRLWEPPKGPHHGKAGTSPVRPEPEARWPAAPSSPPLKPQTIWLAITTLMAATLASQWPGKPSESLPDTVDRSRTAVGLIAVPSVDDSPPDPTRAPAPISAPAATDAPLVASLSFENLNENPTLDQLEVGIASALAEAFVKSGRFRIVERAQLDKVLAELELNQGAFVDPTAAQRLGKLLGAQYVTLGSFQEWQGEIRLNARLLEIETGEVLAAETITGSLEDALYIPEELARKFTVDLPTN